MIPHELAELLNDGVARFETTFEQRKLAKENGLVIVFGEGHDDIQFRGAITDEEECHHHSIINFNENGVIRNRCDDDLCPYYQEKIENSSSITTYWMNGYSNWSYELDMFHATFNIYETNEKKRIHCIGMVFSLSDL